MKSTGVVRKVDHLGRVVIPKELRDTKAITEGAPLEIFTEGDAIVLKKYEPGCIFCGLVGSNDSENLTFKDKVVCKTCRSELKK